MQFEQGDIIRISGFQMRFLVVSKNAFIKATNVFHVCPIMRNILDGPLHIPVVGRNGEAGTVLCEQIKLIDPSARNCMKDDSISYENILNISDAIQGIFEYD